MGTKELLKMSIPPSPLRFLNPAHLGDTLVINAECQKLGRTLAFATVDILKKENGRLVAQGRQTKHLGSPQPTEQNSS